jgi:hypothetical protein
MFESAITPRIVFLAVAVLFSLAGAGLIRNGAKMDKNPSFETPLVSASTRTFAGATLLFAAFVILVTWILNPHF